MCSPNLVCCSSSKLDYMYCLCGVICICRLKHSFNSTSSCIYTKTKPIQRGIVTLNQHILVSCSIFNTKDCWSHNSPLKPITKTTSYPFPPSTTSSSTPKASGLDGVQQTLVGCPDDTRDDMTCEKGNQGSL